jgi:hypothetical protein
MIFQLQDPNTVKVVVSGDGFVSSSTKVRGAAILRNYGGTVTPEPLIPGTLLTGTVLGSLATYEVYPSSSVVGSQIQVTLAASLGAVGPLVVTTAIDTPDVYPPAIPLSASPLPLAVTATLVSRIPVPAVPQPRVVGLQATATVSTWRYKFRETYGIKLPPDGAIRASGALVVALNCTGAGSHGVAGAVVANIPVSADGFATATTSQPAASGNIVIPITAEGYGKQAVKGSGTASVLLTLVVEGHAVQATGGPGLANVPVSCSGTIRHGVSGYYASRVNVTAIGAGEHTRFEVRGTVRASAGGILLARQVRVYHRLTGALVGQGPSVGGEFAVHCGLAPDEYIIVPIDLDPAAIDYTPPAAGRVVSVLARDAA